MTTPGQSYDGTVAMWLCYLELLGLFILLAGLRPPDEAAAALRRLFMLLLLND